MILDYKDIPPYHHMRPLKVDAPVLEFTGSHFDMRPGLLSIYTEQKSLEIRFPAMRGEGENSWNPNATLRVSVPELTLINPLPCEFTYRHDGPEEVYVRQFNAGAAGEYKGKHMIPMLKGFYTYDSIPLFKWLQKPPKPTQAQKVDAMFQHFGQQGHFVLPGEVLKEPHGFSVSNRIRFIPYPEHMVRPYAPLLF